MQVLTKISVTLRKGLGKKFPDIYTNKSSNCRRKIYNVLAVDRQIVKMPKGEIDVRLTKQEKLFTDSDDKALVENQKRKRMMGSQKTVLWFLIASTIDGSFKWVDSTNCRYHNSEGGTTPFEEE